MVSVERSLFFSVVLIMAFQQVTAQGAWASWQEWSAWSECDRTCDTGNQMRSRIRDCEGDPAACIGAFDDSESRVCNEQACPGCDSNPCLNNGMCVDGPDGMFTCVCTPSYTGDFCQTEVCPDGQEFQACGSTCPASCQPQPGDCPDTCIMGCFCIEGTVLDDNGNCIPPEDCPCVLDDGSLLENGEEVALYSEQECSRCTCVEGNLTCVVKTPCSHTCTVAGDPHYETFDGRRYNFMGNCSYVLAEADIIDAFNTTSRYLDEILNDVYFDNMDAEYGDFSVSADNRKCRRGRRTCLNQVIIHIPSQLTTVTMNRDLEVFENGAEVAPPYELTGLVLLLRVESLSPTALIATLFDPGMTVVWDGRSVEIYNPYHWLTYGLCGTFDVNPDNDFRMRDGSIETDVNIFAEDWEDLWCRGDSLE